MAENGLNMNLYLDDDPDPLAIAPHTWVEIDIVADVTVNQTRNKGTVKNRGLGSEKYLSGMKVRSIDLEITHEPDDDMFQVLAAAYDSGDPIGIAAMDRPLNETGSYGLQMDVIVTEFTQTQPLEDSSNWKVKLEPAAKTKFEPALVTVG